MPQKKSNNIFPGPGIVSIVIVVKPRFCSILAMLSNISSNDASFGYRTQQTKLNVTHQPGSEENQSRRSIPSSQTRDEYISSIGQNVFVEKGRINPNAVSNIGAEVSRLAIKYNIAEEFRSKVNLRIDSSGKFTTESSYFIKALNDGKGGTKYQHDSSSMAEIVAELNGNGRDETNLSASVLSHFSNVFNIDIINLKSDHNFCFDIQYSNANGSDNAAEFTIAAMLVGDEYFLYDAKAEKVAHTNLSTGITTFSDVGGSSNVYSDVKEQATQYPVSFSPNPNQKSGLSDMASQIINERLSSFQQK